jgi:hypothetical protein
MDRTRLRHVSSLKYKEPAPFLVRLRALEPQVAASDLSANAKALRTNSLKEYRELREAALFCHGMSKRLGRPVLLAKGESQDYDFVARCDDGSSYSFVPVQLKEVVPADLNPNGTLSEVLQGLASKYVLISKMPQPLERHVADSVGSARQHERVARGCFAGRSGG